MLLNPWGSCFTSENLVTQPSTLCLNALSTSQRMNAGCAQAHWLLVVSLGKLPVASISAIRARGASQTWGATSSQPNINWSENWTHWSNAVSFSLCRLVDQYKLVSKKSIGLPIVFLFFQTLFSDGLQTRRNHMNFDTKYGVTYNTLNTNQKRRQSKRYV